MSNPAKTAATEGLNNLRDTVRPVLINELTAWNINPDAVYINGIAPDGLIIHSNSLTDEAVNHILENYVPDYTSSPYIGLFSVAYSFDDAHRVHQPDLAKIGQIMNDLVSTYG